MRTGQREDAEGMEVVPCLGTSINQTGSAGGGGSEAHLAADLSGTALVCVLVLVLWSTLCKS